MSEGSGRPAYEALPRYRRLIRPNRSLSRRLLATVMAVYVVTELIIGIAFMERGAWLILPFAGLEIAVIAVVLYLVSRHSRDYELVVMDDRHLKVLQRVGTTRRRHEFQRYWVKVLLRLDQTGWYPSRLLLGSHGRFVEVGKWMGEEQRQSFARELQRIIRR
ncbi:MAG: DUF2244 domain-containing protein [Acidiferrobacteraceae bacterium]